MRSLLSDLTDRALDADRARLWVIDGGKALRKAIVERFGHLPLIQRWQEHLRRNVIEHLPEQAQANVNRALRDARESDNAALARRRLQRLAASLDAQHPVAAASLREGLDDTLTVQSMGITGAMYHTLLTRRRLERCQVTLPKAARVPRHECFICCIESQVPTARRR